MLGRFDLADQCRQALVWEPYGFENFMALADGNRLECNRQLPHVEKPVSEFISLACFPGYGANTMGQLPTTTFSAMPFISLEQLLVGGDIS